MLAREIVFLLIFVSFIKEYQSYTDGEVRLYGSGTNDGILEIYHNNQWGSVCDDGWSSEESIVACKQLGFITYSSYSHGNSITTNFWLDDVTCTGDESMLVDCSHSGWGIDNCGSSEGLYLNCSIDGSLRLYGSGTDDGVLEVYHSGRWGTVCDDGWGTEESLVACRQLGYTTFVSYAHGNTINTDFWLDDVTCIGNESWLVSCSNIGWGVDNCNSGEGIYINCTNDGELRLYGFGTDYGILEIYHSGRWGSICDDGWNSEESLVACKQMGFVTYESYNIGNRITNDFWLDNLICNGDETVLVDCSHSGWGVDNCGSSEGISLTCTQDGSIRLYGSGTDDGILEIYHSGRWGSVCDDGWGSEESIVACKQLGYTTYSSYSHYNSITNAFWIDNVRCNGDELMLDECYHNGWGSHNCGSSEGLYLTCTIVEGSLRLYGSGTDDGVLEIYHSSRWGSVCDDGWGPVESIVACRQLGYTTFASYTHGNTITADFWLDDVSCNGEESMLDGCTHSGWGTDNCGSSEGLYLNCTSVEGSLRLLGSGASDGILEIYHDGIWGSICDDGWGSEESIVACKQLGYTTYSSYNHYNSITNDFWLDDVTCNGNELMLTDCSNIGWGSHNCASYEGLYLNCTTAEGSLRLYGSGTDDGILEVYHSGRWGTVCDDGWGTEESLVACRQLGYTTFVSYAHGNTINTDFWLDDVTCIGNESLLLDCSNRGWGVDNCYSSEGIYINCTNELLVSPFVQFSPDYEHNNEEITCDSYEVTDCFDLIFIIDANVLTATSSLARIASLAGSLNQSTVNCTNRYGLTIFGSSIAISIVNLTTNSVFGTPSELQTALNTNLIQGSAVASTDGYKAIHEAVTNYQFRTGVQKKMVLFTDQQTSTTTKEYTNEETLLTLLRNEVILSAFTNADTYTTSLQDRIIGMTGSNRLGYGNYSHCSTTATQDISTGFNAEYIIRNSTEHHAYVELAWLSGGASYDLSYFDASASQFCANLITDVFSFATLADTPCSFNGATYSYSDRVNFPLYTQWEDITPYQASSCVDMVFLVDETGSMSSYYSSIDNVANNLPLNGNSCQNRYGLTIFENSASRRTVGGSSSYWGTPSQLYTALNSFSTSGGTEDGLLAIDYVIDAYTFRTGVVKHIVLFTDEPRATVDSTITNSTVISKLQNAGIILSVVTIADDFYSLQSTPGSLLAGVLLSQSFIGFGNNVNNDTQIDSYSPSTYTIQSSNGHENYIDAAWETGGVAFDLGFYKSSSYYQRTSAVFNRLLFSYETSSGFSIPYDYAPVNIIQTDMVTIISITSVEYQFSCTATSSSDLIMSLLIDGEWYSSNNSTSIQVTLPLSHLTVGTYYFLCIANSSLGSDSSVDTFDIIDIPVYPFLQFSTDYEQDIEEITCDSYELTDCFDLIFIMDANSLAASSSLTRIATLAGSLEQSTSNCANRYGLTIFGSSIAISILNITTNSVFGTPSELQTLLNTNLIQGSAVASTDGYKAIHEAVMNYQFRTGVMKKIVLIADQSPTTTKDYTYEETLLTLLENNVILSVFTNADTYTTSLQNRIIGMTGSNRLGYGNYSHCSTTATQDISTGFNAEYIIRNSTEHHAYVELAWLSGGASYDLSYFDVSASQFCANLITDVFSFATLADTPCSFNGATYSYSDRVNFPLYTQWEDITPYQASSCVDMVFLVDETGSMSSYYSSIDNIANNLPLNGNSCQNRYGLTIFERSASRRTVGGSSSYWGTPSQLYTALNSFSTSGGTEDGLLAIDYVIDAYTFRTGVVKHIVLFTDEPRATVDSTITNSTVIDKLQNAGIILSVVTIADDFYSLQSTPGSLLAGVLLSQSFIGFGNNVNNDTQIDSYSPSTYTIQSSNGHENYIDAAWETGGVAFDLGFYKSSSYYQRTSAVFNRLLFSYESSSGFSIPYDYEPVSIIQTDMVTIISLTSVEYQFSCTATSSSDLIVSLLIDGEWYSSNNSTSIQVTLPLSHLTVGTYYFLCVANSSMGSDSSVDTFDIIDIPVYPFLQFSTDYEQDIEEITCDSYELTDCFDLIFIMDANSLAASSSLTRIATLAGSLEQSTSNCANRYGLTIFGYSIATSIVNVTTNSVFGTPSELQTLLNTNLIQGSAVASTDGYEAIHEAVMNYQFRTGVMKKIVLISDQSPATTKDYTYEETLLTLLENNVILSVFTNADTYTTSLQDRIIGMTGSNRLGYGNYSHCSTTATQDISTGFNAEYIIRNSTEHHAYVELAWLSGGASYDLSYFDVSASQFCANLITDVFSFATLADTPCSFNGATYSYSDRVNFPLYTQWEDIIPYQASSCVDMVFLVDETGSMSSYYSSIDNIANNLPLNGNSCQNRYGLTIFENSARRRTVGGSSSYWGTPSQLYTALNSFSTSGGTEDGLLAIDYVIDAYTFRTGVVKHIVLFTDEPRATVDSTITNSTVISKLQNAAIILSVVTIADDFYSLQSTPDSLLAGVLLSQSFIGFGNNVNNDTQIDSYSPSTYTIQSSNGHENYIDAAWETGGVAFDLGFYQSSSYHQRTSAVFNRLLFSYETSSGFSIPFSLEPVKIVDTDVLTNVTKYYVEYQFSCTATSSSDLIMSLLIDGEWYSSNNSTSIQVTLPLSHLTVGTYYFLCVANSSMGSDSSVDTFDIIEIPIYPFQQFLPDFKNGETISCGNFIHTNCVDLVLIISLTQRLDDEMDRLLQLIDTLPNSTYNCVNNFGLTLFGLSTGSLIVNVSTDSYFGTAQQLRASIIQNQNIWYTIGAGVEDAYLGIHNALENYVFRNGVKRRMLLVTKEPRQTSADTEQYNYESTLTELLKNDITLSLVSYGAHYTAESTQERLIGMIYNNRIGFGVYSENVCTNPLEPVLDVQFSITNNDIYISYNELAWSTDGAAFDLSYFNASQSNYCPSLLLDAFTFAIFSEATCEFHANIFTYGSESTADSRTIWTDINPQAFSNCVDMVFVVDRTSSLNSYLPGFESIVTNLPTNGESCINRYGLTIFEDYPEIIYVGGGSLLFGTPSQLLSGLSYTKLGSQEDGLLAIDYVIDYYNSSFRSDVQKHIILMTDEPRTIISSSTTKLTVLNKLNQAGIILSVITLANDLYYDNGTYIYEMAAVQASNTVIGFANWIDPSDKIDAISPISLNILDSNAYANFVELAWETGGIAFDLYFCKYSQYYSRLSATYNKLMYSWGGRTNSSITATYAPVLVSAINSTVINSSIGELIYSFSCIASSVSTTNISMFIDGIWYSNEESHSIGKEVIFEYPYPHPGSYNFICIANSSIGGDQTLGVYTVPDTPRIYPQYSQFTYIPDSKIECDSIALQETHCMDLVVILDISAYTDTVIDRISSLAASLPANASTCTNRYGLTLFGTSSLSQTISLTSSTTQSYFSTPSDLSAAIKLQRNIASTLGSGSKDGYEAIHNVIKQYSFRENVQRKIFLFSNEAREIAPLFSNLTFWNTVQTLLANRVTLHTVSASEIFYYFYNNTNNRLIGMHYNTRTGVGNFSSSCNYSVDNLASIPSAEYSVILQREHEDYVELAWKSNGVAFDLNYFDKNTDYCPVLIDAVIQYAGVKDFPCTLDIVDYAFTTRTQFPTLSIWENILPQVDTSCVYMVFLLDSSLPYSTYSKILNNVYYNLVFNTYRCNHYSSSNYTMDKLNEKALNSSNCTIINNPASGALVHSFTGYFYTDTYDGIQDVIDNQGFQTDYIKHIVVVTEQPRMIVETRYTKSSILSSLRTNGIILSVITNAGTFYTNQSSPLSLLAAVRVSDTIVGFGNTGSNSSILDAVSPAVYNVSNNITDDDYVDLAWKTGGVAFNIDLLPNSQDALSHFTTLVFIWGDTNPIQITYMNVRSQGPLSSPGPYEFTCTINSVPHATLTLVIQGVSYVETDATSIIQVLTLSDETPGTYQYICSASNSNGGDTQRDIFTIIEPIPSPFDQFAFTPDAGKSCNTFQLTTCVDLIFLLDISGSINSELDRIAELGGNLPNASGTCENRYGLTLFALTGNAVVFNLSTDSLYGGPAELKSVILSSKNIGGTLGYGPEDGYPAIHQALSEFPFREGVERRLVLFANESRTTTSTTSKYNYENTISLLLQYKIKLTAVTYSGLIYHYTSVSSNRLIGMNFFSNIGFGNFSATHSQVNPIPNPDFSTNDAATFQSYVNLAFDTHGSILDMRYFYKYNSPYSPTLITNLFKFAVIENVPCDLNDIAFNFDTRTLTSSTPYYSEWTQITPQVVSSCVDMVFLVDRTASLSSYLPGITNVAKYLPENGDGCVNRYGLVTFERTAIVFYLNGTSKFGSASQLYKELTLFSFSGGTEDAYVGIDSVINEFEFRDSTQVRKHIILFADEPRSIVNSSLTTSSMFQSLVDNRIILTTVSDTSYFYKPSSSIRLQAATLVADSQIGFMVTTEQNVDVFSPMDLSIQYSSQHIDYVELAWLTGGIAFDLSYFTDSNDNLKTVVTSFNTLMFSWGTFLPIQLDSTSSDESNHIIIECSINSIPNASISLIVGDSRYSDANTDTLRTVLYSWNSTGLSYVCLANNSISGDSHIKPLDIIIPTGPPANATLTVQSSTSILAEWDHPTTSVNILFIRYRVVFQGKLFNTEIQSSDTIPATYFTLDNLLPYTMYSVYIEAITPSNINQTNVLQATTFQAVPTETPQNVTAVAVNSTSIQLTLYPPSPDHQNGPIRSYIITYLQQSFSDTGETEKLTIHISSSEAYPLVKSSEIRVYSLHPFTDYTFNIIAANDAGSSPSVDITVKTDPAVPSQPPQNVTAYAQSSTAIVVFYYPPPSADQNGIITSFRISIKGTPFDTDVDVTSLTVATPVYPLETGASHLITQLHAYNTYSIEITAVNSVGESGLSDTVSITTLQSAPTEIPQNVTAVAVDSTSIQITVYPPSPNHQNGPIRSYIITYLQQSFSDAGETEKLTIHISSTEAYPLVKSSEIRVYSLHPFTDYTFNIIATNDAGSSPSVDITTTTDPAVPSQPPQNVTAHAQSSTAIVVFYYPPPSADQNGIITSFRISIEGTPFDTDVDVTSLTVATPVYPLETGASHLITQLHAYNTYSIEITAVNSVGESGSSDTVSKTTLQSVPTQPPQNPTAVALSSYSILCTFYPPSSFYQNGPIRTYSIYYRPENNLSTAQTLSLLVEDSAVYPLEESSEITIPSLLPYTTYILTLVALNDAGPSPNVSVSVRTHVAAPTETPQNVTAVAIDSTSIQITVYPPSPDHQNGPIRNYTISYPQQSLSDTGETEKIVMHIILAEDTYPLVESSEIVVNSLQPFTDYIFNVVATNDAGLSPSVEVSAKTNPSDSIPTITSPPSNTTYSPTLTYTYTQTITCTATGYPPPTILWYNSDNEPITTGPSLQLDASKVSDGILYICKAENRVGSDSRSIKFSISESDIDIDGILGDISDDIGTSDFDPNQAGLIADIISNILPDTSNIPITDVNDTQNILGNVANTNEDLLDKITDNDTAITPEDAGKIANTAGNIINKDNDLDRSIDSPTLSPEAVNQGGIASASDALIIALRTIEKVCHNLGRNYFTNEQIQDSFVVNSTYVQIYGANIPVASLTNEVTLPINANAESLQDSVSISGNAAVNLADSQTSLKVVIAIVKKYKGVDASQGGTGPKQDSNIIIVVIPDKTGIVSLIENATMTFSTTSNYTTNKVGSFLDENLWTTNGITTQLTSDTTINLNINHFTSFVVFATFSPPASILGYYLALASYVLSGISVLCLVSSLFLFIFSGKKGFFKTEINILYFNLCIALLISNLLFILYGLKPDVIGFGDLLCKIIAAVIHYSWVLVFSWCFGFAIYITLKINFGLNKSRRLYPYIILFAWTIPLLFPILTLAIKFEFYVDTSKHCFPSKEEYILLGLLMPILVLSLITLVACVFMCIRFVNVRKRLENDVIRTDIKHIMLSTVILTSLLSIPWITLMVYFFIDNSLVEWVFVLLNDTTGIFFLIFIALRVNEVIDFILCKSTRNVTETPQTDPRLNAFHNPIYEGNIQEIMDPDDYEYQMKKLGADFLPQDMKDNMCMEKGVQNKISESSYYNPYQMAPSVSSFSNQMYGSDLPPIYDHVAGDHSDHMGFSNPIYETATGECGDGIYEELNFNNPFREDIDAQEVETPIDPTGTQVDKENLFDV